MGQGGERVCCFPEASKTLKEHVAEIIEAIHERIESAQRMARGFRSFRYLRIAALLKTERLRLDLLALPT